MLSVSATSNSRPAGDLLKMHLILPLHACHLPNITGVQICFESSYRATLRQWKTMGYRETISVRGLRIES